MAIDIVTFIQGVEFRDAIQNSIGVQFQGIVVRLLSMSDLILTKKASGCFKDLDDLENLGND